MGRLAAIVAKEVRELSKERTVLFGLILMPFIVFSLMGVVVSESLQRAQEAVEEPVVLAVAVEPGAGPGDEALARALAAAANASYVGEAGDPAALLGAGYEAVVVVRAGAWENLTRGRPASVEVHVEVGGLSFVEQARAQKVLAIAVEAGRAVLASTLSRLAGAEVSPEVLASPLLPEQRIYLKGVEVDSQVYQALAATLTFTAMALFIMVMSGIQVASTSMGIEREAKTLEMLLASPLTVREIVLGKIAGVALVTLAGLASYAAGLAVYYNSLSGVEGFQGFRADALAYVAPALAATLYATAAIGLLAGMTAQDVRGAQLVGAQLAFFLEIPYFAALLGLAPPPGTPAYALLLLDPLYPPLAAAYSGLTGDAAGLAMAYAAAAGHVALWTIAAVKLMSPERLLLGFGVVQKLKRLRGAGVTAARSG